MMETIKINNNNNDLLNEPMLDMTLNRSSSHNLIDSIDSITTGCNNNNNNNSSAVSSSYQLASKLRKIKENLDNCYLNSSVSQTTTTMTTTSTSTKTTSHLATTTTNSTNNNSKLDKNQINSSSNSTTSSSPSSSSSLPLQKSNNLKFSNKYESDFKTTSSTNVSNQSAAIKTTTKSKTTKELIETFNPINNNSNLYYSKILSPIVATTTTTTTEPPHRNRHNQHQHHPQQNAISKYQTNNLNGSNYELNNNRIDFILDQFNNKQQSSNDHQINNINNNNKPTSLLLQKTSNYQSTPLYNHQHQLQQQQPSQYEYLNNKNPIRNNNFSFNSDKIIPIYSDFVSNSEFNLPSRLNVNANTSSHANNNNSNNNSKQIYTTDLNENTNLVSLKQVIFTDNISRQSSIRSLISNNNNIDSISPIKRNSNDNNNKNNSTTQQLLKATISTGQLMTQSPGMKMMMTKSPSEILIHDSAMSSSSNPLNEKIYSNNKIPTSTSFNKVKYLKAKNNNSNTISPTYSKSEIELLNDWDSYNRPEEELSSVAASFNDDHKLKLRENENYSTYSSNSATLSRRPQTRLDFRSDNNIGTANVYDDDDDDDEELNDERILIAKDKHHNQHHQNLNGNHRNGNNKSTNNCIEDSDNVTVASSSNSSSERYLESEDYESYTPTNEKNYNISFYKINDHDNDHDNNNNKINESSTTNHLNSNNLNSKHNNSLNHNLSTHSVHHHSKTPDNETESVLSDFVSNLKFDDSFNTNKNINNDGTNFISNNQNNKNRNFNSNDKNSPDELMPDYEINTISEPIQDDDDNSFILRNTNKNNNHKNKMSSLIIREKYDNNSNKTNLNSYFKNQNEFENTDNERVRNYQRLSNSINDLFANLLQQLEKQKTKDYSTDAAGLKLNSNATKNSNNNNLNGSNSDFINKNTLNQLNSDDRGFLSSGSLILNKTKQKLNHYSNQNEYINQFKNDLKPNRSKDSNKDSGFNQEITFDNKDSIFYTKSSLFENISSSKNDNDLNSKKSNKKASAENSNKLRKDDLFLSSNGHLDQELICKNNRNSRLENFDEISLLERYLNNEQLIAHKHSQLENLLKKTFSNKNSNTGLGLVEDFSLIEYIMNQEGISRGTFKKLIREKFKNIEWSDEVLFKMHKILNQPCESQTLTADYDSKKNGVSVEANIDDDLNENYLDDVENELYIDQDDDVDIDYQYNEEYDNDKDNDQVINEFIDANDVKKSSSLNHLKKLSQQQPEDQYSPSNSSKSHKKLKDIKNSTYYKKKLNNHQIEKEPFSVLGNVASETYPFPHSLDLNNEFVQSSNFNNTTINSNNLNSITNEEEILKKNLSNSFGKRRERKGSLPEINSTHIIGFDNPNFELQNSSYLTFIPANSTITTTTNNNNILNAPITSTNNSNLFRTINNRNDVSNHSARFTESSTKSNSIQNKSNFSDKRMSRKSAFVLEVLRTSMFRSKSLTDLNSSLCKIENNNNNASPTTNKYFTKIANNINGTLDSNAYNSKMDTVDSNLNNSNLSTATLSNNQMIEENYIGLVWQCADMIYEEYRNKYEELSWLLNGDKVSSSSKLKEVEQRLKIELKLKEKNLNLIEKLNSENLINKENKNKYFQQRLESQLKVINEKIKELELMRLYLRICQINSHGLDSENLNEFFNNIMSMSFTKNHDQNKQNLLQGKSYDEILKSLYGCDAICSGFVYQFFVIYRYMFSSIELLEFFKDNFTKGYLMYSRQKDKTYLVLDRTIDLIAMWLDGFFMIDFQQNQELIDLLTKFIENEIKIYNESKSRILLNLIQNPNIEFDLFTSKTKSQLKSNRKMIKKSEQETKKVNRILNGTIKKRILNNLNLKSKSNEQLNQIDDPNLTTNSIKRDGFFISDYPLELISSQLTLIEWDNFLDIHVCHCLNSKAQGVNCDSKQPIDPNNINSQQCLFVDNYLSKSLYKMIQFNYLLTHWVSAEILMIDNAKNQAALITKFLKIAKKCYDWSNFSTAFSIYDGLQEITVRNLPAWQYVTNKTIHILEKIASFKLLFQNEPFIISLLSKSTNTPVIPSMHLFLLIVQKSEHGSFQLANGQWKWSKFSYLANLVDQIRVIQQHYVCNFMPCDEFVDDLLQRIYYCKSLDLNQLAENNCQDYYHSQKLNTSSSTIMSLIPIRKRFL